MPVHISILQKNYFHSFFFGYPLPLFYFINIMDRIGINNHVATFTVMDDLIFVNPKMTL